MSLNSVGPPRINIKEEIWDRYRRFRAGDIVRIVDEDDGKGYFAQISAFVTDNYAQRFALIIWLLPRLVGNSFANTSQFNPDKFQHGLAEERPVPIEACEFICECPSFSPYKRGWTPSNQILVLKRKEIARRVEGAEMNV